MFNPWSSRKPSSVTKGKKKKKNKKELLIALLFFYSRKLMRDLEYKKSKYLEGIVAEVRNFPVKVHYSQVSASV